MGRAPAAVPTSGSTCVAVDAALCSPGATCWNTWVRKAPAPAELFGLIIAFDPYRREAVKDSPGPSASVTAGKSPAIAA